MNGEPDFEEWVEEWLKFPDIARIEAMLDQAYQLGLENGMSVTKLPKIPTQWPVQLGADNKLHLVRQPPRPLAKVIPFPYDRIKRDTKPLPPDDIPPPRAA